jgi:urease accessory protein
MNAPNVNHITDDSNQLVKTSDLYETPQVILIFKISPAGNTYLSMQRGAYPYHIGRLLKNTQTPDVMAMLLLQCTSGGLFEHDRISLQLTAMEDAIASVKHAAATVVHSSKEGGNAQSTMDIVADQNTYLEYVGNINILFPNSALINNINVSLHPNSMVLISDTYLMHDPSQTAAHFSQLTTTLNVINADKKLLTRDRLVIDGPSLATQLSAVNNAFNTHSTLYLLIENNTDLQLAQILDSINTMITSLGLKTNDAYIGTGTLPNQCGVFIRLLSHSAEPVNHLVKGLSAIARGYYFNK